MTATIPDGDPAQAEITTRNLAIQLVRHMGLKRAMYTCRQNDWRAVLAAIETMTPPARL